MAKMKLNKEPSLDVKHLGFSYQNEAVNSVKDLDYCAVFHEQGLGKTKIAIDVFLYWIETKKVDTVLLVVKKGLLQNWILELEEHCYVKPFILSQNKKNNFFVFNGPSRLILTNFEVLKSEKSRLKLFLKARDVGIVIDESAKIKNPTSVLTQSFFDLSPLFKKKMIMTGTPIANRPYDIWAQIYFLDRGKSLGADFKDFKNGIELSNDLIRDPIRQNEFENSVSNIYDKIKGFTVRETKNSGVIKLPEKIYETIETDWEQIQQEKYDQLKNEMKLIVVREGILEEDLSENNLKRLLRLLQVCSNPKIINSEYTREPGKIPFLQDLIYKITLNHEKCIVWSSFIENINYLYKHFEDYYPVKVHGNMDMVSRNRSIEKFKKDKKTKILFATPGAAKEGLTLTIANHVIFYDRGFSLDDYLQAQDRIHRISQNKTCYVYNLVMKDSIDEWVDVLLKAKHLSAQLGQGDISLDYYKSQISYSYGEVIREILNID